MENYTLSNGKEIPVLGFGTFPMKKMELVKAVWDGVDVGYRLFDTATAYRNELELGGDPMDAFRRYAANGGPKGPSSLDARYLTEDVPNGLGLLCSIGDAIGAPTRIAKSIMTIAGALLGRNFFSEARTLKRLGFDSFSALWKLCEEL